MKRISCTETSCEYNCCLGCKKNKILVEENAVCESYEKRKDDENETSKYLEEYAILHGEYVEDDHLILCESKSCVSNERGVCSRNGISVSKTNFQPTCANYRSK